MQAGHRNIKSQMGDTRETMLVVTAMKSIWPPTEGIPKEHGISLETVLERDNMSDITKALHPETVRATITILHTLRLTKNMAR